jgi:hypothetical protein
MEMICLLQWETVALGWKTDLCLTEEPSHKALTTHSVVHMYLRPLARQEIDAVQGQEVNKTATM